MVATMRSFLTSFVLVGLFMFGFLSFAMQAQSENTADPLLTADPTLNSSFYGIQSRLNALEPTAQGARTALEEANPVTGALSVIIDAVVAVPVTLFSLIMGMINIITNTVAVTLGIPQIVINVLLGIIIITYSFLFWNAVRGGNN